MSKWKPINVLKHQPIGTKGRIEISPGAQYEPYVSDFSIVDKSIYSVTVHTEIRKKKHGQPQPSTPAYGRIVINYDDPSYRIDLDTRPYVTKQTEAIGK